MSIRCSFDPIFFFRFLTFRRMNQEDHSKAADYVTMPKPTRRAVKACRFCRQRKVSRAFSTTALKTIHRVHTIGGYVEIPADSRELIDEM